MTQYAVLNYYYNSTIAQVITLYNSIHKKTCTTSRINSSVMANALKVGLENMPQNIVFQQTLTGHYKTYNIVSILSVQ